MREREGRTCCSHPCRPHLAGGQLRRAQHLWRHPGQHAAAAGHALRRAQNHGHLQRGRRAAIEKTSGGLARWPGSSLSEQSGGCNSCQQPQTRAPQASRNRFLNRTCRSGSRGGQGNPHLAPRQPIPHHLGRGPPVAPPQQHVPAPAGRFVEGCRVWRDGAAGTCAVRGPGRHSHR